MTGEEKRLSLRAAAAANDNEEDNTRIGPLPLEEEHAATTMDMDCCWGQSIHHARGRRSVPLTGVRTMTDAAW